MSKPCDDDDTKGGKDPTKGQINAFAHTPQAKDDIFNIGPTGTQFALNVMGNDAGGNGKHLYSIDDGISAGGNRPTDLLKQDKVGAVEHSRLGADISITADGKVSYQISQSLADQLANTGSDQTLSDTFTYAIRMGNNGALSWAEATVNLTGRHVDHELLSNWSFEQDQTTTGGAYQSYSTLPGWTTQPGSAGLEVVSAGYLGIQGDGHWLDTQGSPGGIDISQTVDVITGHHATLSFSVAGEYLNDTLKTDPNEHLQFVWNGNVVADVKQADLGDYGTFHNFSLQVAGQAGADTLEIHSVGANGLVGLALDKVSLVG